MIMINADNYKHTDITEKIIKAFFKVYNTLGFGFLEKVYENALFKSNGNSPACAGLNFGKKPEFKRKVFTNKKNHI